MRPKSGLPKRKALRNMPEFEYGFRTNPAAQAYRNPFIGDSKLPSPPHQVSVVSLFSGCGGLDLGLLGGFRYLGDQFDPLPFRIKAAYDNDTRAMETYRLNIGDHCRECDLSTVDISTLPKADLMLGGFPCQDFSSCGPKQGFDGKRGLLYKVLAEYMKVHQPKVVIGENVPHLARMNEGEYLKTIAEDFAAEGYRVQVWFLYCPNYGLPQHRQCVFIVCTRNDLPGQPEEPPMTHFMHYRFIEDALDDLKGVTDEAVPNQRQYFVATKATAGAGQGDQTSMKGKFAYAVRANPKARVHFHYDLPRRLTVRECARLQSFPDEFVFPHSTSHGMSNIGNAVPPIVAHAVGKQLAAYFHQLRTNQVRGKAS